MSFTLDIINELTEREPDKVCCKKSFLFGLFFGAEKIFKTEIRAELKTEQSANLAANILKKQFSLEPTVEPIVRAGRHMFWVTVNSKMLATYLESLDGAESVSVDKLGKIVGFNDKCYCEMYFLAGVFVALGTATDPQKRYSLEFSVKGKMRTMWLNVFLASKTGEPSYIERSTKIGLYYRGNENICDVLAYMGANSSYSVALDVFVDHDIKNRENRATNCVLKNIKKSVDAARTQIEAIEYLKSKGRFNSLSEDLKYTAKLRCENASVSLSELAALHEPSISKSGLNRRLDRIISFAREVKALND
jgi:DNA-binding protein WhiA